MATMTAQRLDEEIQREVLEELKWDARVQPNEIGVAVKDGIAVLTGWVDSFSKKWAAERAAHRVRGVTAVVNDVEIRLPRSAERTDADIAAAATRALESHAGLPIENIEVTVSKGWVTLRGEGRVAIPEVRRRAGGSPVVRGAWREQPDQGQAAGEALARHAQAQDRGGLGA